MTTEYIKCPVLLAEYQQLDESSVDEYISHLETRRYSHGTITSYVSCVVHYFSWRRSIGKRHSIKISGKHIRSFLSRHLRTCKCPPSFQRGRASCGASLRLWFRIIAEKDLVIISTKEDNLLAETMETMEDNGVKSTHSSFFVTNNGNNGVKSTHSSFFVTGCEAVVTQSRLCGYFQQPNYLGLSCRQMVEVTLN